MSESSLGRPLLANGIPWGKLGKGKLDEEEEGAEEEDGADPDDDDDEEEEEE